MEESERELFAVLESILRALLTLALAGRSREVSLNRSTLEVWVQSVCSGNCLENASGPPGVLGCSHLDGRLVISCVLMSLLEDTVSG